MLIPIFGPNNYDHIATLQITKQELKFFNEQEMANLKIIVIMLREKLLGIFYRDYMSYISKRVERVT
jgi:hypothetical protein